MSVWEQIDEMKAKHDHEVSKTRSQLEGYGYVKGSLKADEFGFWRCKYARAFDKVRFELSERSGAALVERLKKIRVEEELEKQNYARSQR